MRPPTESAHESKVIRMRRARTLVTPVNFALVVFVMTFVCFFALRAKKEILIGNYIRASHGPGGKRLCGPTGIAIAPNGAMYVSDTADRRVLRVGRDGRVTSVAMSVGRRPGVCQRLGAPAGLAVDREGNLYCADEEYNCIWRIGRTGRCELIAGLPGRVSRIRPIAGSIGDNGPAPDARFLNPVGVAMDGSGNLYVADTRNNRVREVKRSGIIITLAGDGRPGFSGDGGPANRARLDYPEYIAVGAGGRIYIADTNNGRVRAIDPRGIIRTVAGGGKGLFNGAVATTVRLNGLGGLAVDAGGAVLVADEGRILRIGNDGRVRIIAGRYMAPRRGDGGLAREARLDGPEGLAIDSRQNIFVTDAEDNSVREIDVRGTIHTVLR